MSISERQRKLESLIDWALWEAVRLNGLNHAPVSELIAQRVEEFLVSEELFEEES